MKTSRIYEIIQQKYNKDGTLKHINKEGARYHVTWWNNQGVHCTVKDCEINKNLK